VTALVKFYTRLLGGPPLAPRQEFPCMPNARAGRWTGSRRAWPATLSDDQRQRLAEIASRCPIHRTLTEGV